VDQLIHGTDEQLEAYVLGRLSDSEEETLEEHLLVCASCRTAVDQQLVFTSGMREALADAGPQRDWLAWLRPVLTPRFAVAGALAAVVVAAGLYFVAGDHTHYAPVAALQLTAIRGTTPSVEPAREIDLTLNSFPTTGGPFKVEVVDANGGNIWTGTTSSPSVAIHAKFRPGSYFVRLYAASGDLLHEYGFRVEQENR
jgi:hypothetical protein